MRRLPHPNGSVVLPLPDPSNGIVPTPFPGSSPAPGPVPPACRRGPWARPGPRKAIFRPSGAAASRPGPFRARGRGRAWAGARLRSGPESARSRHRNFTGRESRVDGGVRRASATLRPMEPRPPADSLAPAAFPPTLWSALLEGRAGGREERRQALETLIGRYWQPVFTAVRFGWRLPLEDAKEATQAFFLDLLERDVLAEIDPARGRLRAWLKAALKHFLLNRRRDAARLKRGGERGPLPLEQAERLEAREAPPDEVLDEQWLAAVVGRALDALRRELVEAGKADAYEAFRRYDLGQGSGDAPVTYASLAAELGLKESDVRNRLHAARLRLRALVRAEIRSYALDAEEEAEELRWILG